MDGKIILNALWISWTVINPGRLLILRNSGKSIRDQSLVIANHINKVTGIIGAGGSYRATTQPVLFGFPPSPRGKIRKWAVSLPDPASGLNWESPQGYGGCVCVLCYYYLLEVSVVRGTNGSKH